MKSYILSAFVLSALFFCNAGFCRVISDKVENTPGNGPVADTLKILSTPELNNLTLTWIREFRKYNPSIIFSLGSITADQSNKTDGIYFVPDDFTRLPGNSSAWKISLGHDVIVPVFNARNPMINEICDQGISTAEFARLLSGNVKLSWADIIIGGQNIPVNLYMIDNTEIKAGISGYIKTDPADLNLIPAAKERDFISFIQKNPYAIGFCRLSDVRQEGLNALKEDIRLLPIDKNGNGRVDNFESIYNTPDDLSRGAWIGKFPHALTRSIYAMSQNKPTDKNAIAFLSWIINDGGQYMPSNGYSDLIATEKQANLASLVNMDGNETTPEGRANSQFSYIWLIFLAVLVTMGLILAAAIFANMRSGAVEEAANHVRVFNENTVRSPGGLFFDKTHTWAFMEQDGIIVVGIDDFLQHITGSISRVMMKEPGEMVRRGEKLLTMIRDGKQLELYAPVSGTIKAHNTNLYKDSSIINASPYSDGWIYRVEPRNWLREIQFMFMGDKYKEWLRDEFIRLRNFFELMMKSNNPAYNLIVLQDGGEVMDNVLADLGPEVWEEFQSKFIDPSK